MADLVRLLALLALTASPAAAQSWIDYDLLLKQNAGNVHSRVEKNGHTIRTLDMGNGVVVECDNDSCVGIDYEGAIGCIFLIAIDLRAVVRACQFPVEAERLDMLDQIYEQIGRYVAANAVPQLTWDQLQKIAVSTTPTTPESCESMRADALMLFENLANREVLEAMPGLSKAESRLPVVNPCL